MSMAGHISSLLASEVVYSGIAACTHCTRQKLKTQTVDCHFVKDCLHLQITTTLAL